MTHRSSFFDLRKNTKLKLFRPLRTLFSKPRAPFPNTDLQSPILSLPVNNWLGLRLRFSQFKSQVDYPLSYRLILFLLMTIVPLSSTAQTVDLFIPDLSFGVHRLSDPGNSGRIYLPVYAQNNTGNALSINSLILDFAINDPSGMIDGGSSSIRIEVDTPFLPSSFGESPFAGTNGFLEGQIESNLPRSFAFGTQLVFPTTSVPDRSFVLATFQNDIAFGVGEILLFGVIEIPLLVADALSTGVLTISEFGTDGNILGLAGGGDVPLVFAMGSEPDGVASVQVCPSASVAVDQGGNVFQPDTDSFCLNTSLTLTVEVVGGEVPTSFTWFKDGLEIVDVNGISGATTATLSLPGNVSDAGEYVCEITTSCSIYRTQNLILNASEPLAIITHPASQLLCDESLELFIVVDGNASSSFNYQWLKDGLPLSDGNGIFGATTDTLFISSSSVEARSYSVQVSNTCEMIESNLAVIEIDEIIITSEPMEQEVCEGDMVSFTVSVDSASPVSYEWRRSGIPLMSGNGVSGVDTNTLMIANASLNDQGLYSCRIINDCVVEVTQNADLSVRTPPSISSQTTSFSACQGTQTNLTVFTDSYTSTHGTYQWELFSEAFGIFREISGATTSVLPISFNTASSFTRYRCTITNPCGSTMSEEIEVTQTIALTLTQDIESVQVCEGETATFSLQVMGDGPVQIQWFQDGMEIVGASDTSLSIANVSMNDVASYEAEITNACGTISSSKATLTLRDFSVSVSPGSIGMGVNPIIFNAQSFCGQGSVSYEWRDAGDVIVSQTESLLIEPTLNETETFTVTGRDDTSGESSASVTILVSENPSLVDPNGDGMNTREDVVLVSNDWASGSLTFDADGDGQLTVKDLAFVNGGS
jgi:hypothetical protein